MKRMHHGLLVMATAGSLAIAAAACDDPARGLKRDAQEATDAAKTAAPDARGEAKDKPDAVKAETHAIDAATQTLDVKAALMADATVDASDINVDTRNEIKTVVLRGSVPTATQKAEAGRIAAREATGYRVDNQLVIRPRQ